MKKQCELKGVFRNLHPRLQAILEDMNIVIPTPIQEKAIPFILEGKDVIISSPTGTGKTEAAVLPILSMMIEHKWRGLPLFVYITPLRALNRDIYRRLEEISERLGLKVIVRHGDSTQSERKRFSSSMFHWFITTPETFSIILSHPQLRDKLRDIKWIVLDEIHELIDNERGSIIEVSLARLKRIVEKIQFIGLSATISDPDLFKSYYPCGKSCVFVSDVSPREILFKVRTVEDGVSKDPSSRAEELVNIAIDEIRNARSAIIFTNTRDMAEILGYRFREKGVDWVEVHHGSLSTGIRKDVENRLKEGKIKAVIATSSLELGIDIGSIDIVIQYGSPRQATRLAQRVGRSGHRLNMVSKGVILAEPSLDDIIESVVIARRVKHGLLEKPVPHRNPLDVLVHQIIGILLSKESDNLTGIKKILRKTYSFGSLPEYVLENVIDYMIDTRMIVKRIDNTYGVTNRARRYYYTTTMIPDSKRLPVYTVYGERIGFLDEDFVVSKLDEGTNFLLAGREWTVVSIEDEKVVVEEVLERKGLPPSWQGDLIPVSFKVAREACSLIQRIYKGEDHCKIQAQYPMFSRESFDIVYRITREAREKGFLPPGPNYFLIEDNNEGLLVLYTCLGTKGNDTLALLLMDYITSRQGKRVQTFTDPYRIYLESPCNIGTKSVIEALEVISKYSKWRLKDELEEIVKRTQLFTYKLTVVARKMGVISKEASLDIVKKKIRYLKDTPVADEALREIMVEKLDLDLISSILHEINEGILKIRLQRRKGLSPFTYYSARSMHPLSSVPDSLPRDLMLKMLEKRIMEKNVLLKCMLCGWEKTMKVGSLPEEIVCPKCGSKAIAPIPPGNTMFIDAVNKYFKKGKRSLRGKEREYFIDATKRANLVLNYGRKAVFALTPYGVGPKGAAKALSRLKLGWEEFLKTLYDEERNFFRTRKFWD